MGHEYLAWSADESGQILTFIVTNDTNPALFSVAPAVNATTGNLTYTPSGTAGSATISLELQDNGGTANGGSNTSPIQTFVITVSASGANQPPVITAPGSAQTTLENQPLVFSSGNGNLISFTDSDALGTDSEQIALQSPAAPPRSSTTSGLTLVSGANGTASFTYTGTISALDAALSGLTYTPAANLNGTGAGNVQLVVNDLGHNGTGGAKTDNRTVSINITPVNQAPSFVKGPDETVPENSPAQSFTPWATSISPGPANESSQAVNFIVGNNNNALFSVQPSIDSSGQLTFTPAPNVNGSATVTVQIHDNGGTANGGVDTSAAQTFNITVSPVNQPPVITAPSGSPHAVENVAYVYSASELNAISISDPDANGGSEQLSLSTSNGTLTLAGLTNLTGSGNGTGSLTYTGTLADLNNALNGLAFTPTNNFTGTATILITASDLGNSGPGGADRRNGSVSLNVIAPSSLVINELFVNPPGTDNPNDYIEFRSPFASNYTIPQGTYLISISGSPTNVSGFTYPTGTVFDTFDLSGDQTGSNGFLVLLQNSNTYVADGLIDPNTAVLDNTSLGTGAGFGNNLGFTGSSIVGHSARSCATTTSTCSSRLRPTC